MDAFRIVGRRPLTGSVDVSGSKNAALPIMAASILTSEPVSLSRVPELGDVRTLSLMLRHLGLWVERSADGTMQLATIDDAPARASEQLVRRMRASFCVLGPLLARRGRAAVPLPGGCAIGERPVDLHLRGLSALGADLRLRRGWVLASARRLRGATIDMSGPSGPTVTGTANVMCAAVLARGQTIVTGAATEPEIVDLGRFLIALGARIAGLGTPTIEIRGVADLGGARYRVIPDRIEAATLLSAAMLTGGAITLRGAAPSQMHAVLETLAEMGSSIDLTQDSITLRAPDCIRPVDIVARPYPHVPTDVQSQLTAIATRATGTSRVADRVFPARFQHLRQLARLGADIRRTRDGAVVRGVPRLHGGRLTATDLRASAALVLAGLAAEGTTWVRGTHHLDRGYEQFDDKLRRLGAQIERVSLALPAAQTQSAAGQQAAFV